LYGLGECIRFYSNYYILISYTTSEGFTPNNSPQKWKLLIPNLKNNGAYDVDGNYCGLGPATPYDNGKIYSVGNVVIFNGNTYSFTTFIGAAGYTPTGYPQYWKLVTIFLSATAPVSKLLADLGPGFVGPKGSTGKTGSTGPIGSQGPQGFYGVTGAYGLSNNTPGITGYQGIQGDAGPEGMQGTTGPTGTTGPIGPLGETGNVGNTGTFINIDPNISIFTNAGTENVIKTPNGYEFPGGYQVNNFSRDSTIETRGNAYFILCTPTPVAIPPKAIGAKIIALGAPILGQGNANYSGRILITNVTLNSNSVLELSAGVSPVLAIKYFTQYGLNYAYYKPFKNTVAKLNGSIFIDMGNRVYPPGSKIINEFPSTSETVQIKIPLYGGAYATDYRTTFYGGGVGGYVRPQGDYSSPTKYNTFYGGAPYEINPVTYESDKVPFPSNFGGLFIIQWYTTP